MKNLVRIAWIAGMLIPLCSWSQFIDFQNGSLTQNLNESQVTREINFLDQDALEITYHIPGAYIQDMLEQEQNFQQWFIEGFTHLHQVGAPAIPARNELIAIPQGAKVKLELVNASYQLVPCDKIYPALQPARDTEGAPEPEFEINEEIYQSDEFYPANQIEYLHSVLVRGNDLALIQMVPVQYNPVKGVAKIYSEITYRISFEGGKSSFEYLANENSIVFTNQLKQIVLNSKSIPDGLTTNATTLKSNGKNYIIVTHDQLLNEANQLANWKRQLGYSVEIISSSSWSSSQIKSEIQARYDNWTPKPDYVLIFGDHTGSCPVPGEMQLDPFYGNNFATDLYYVCMDGAADWHPDMAHGRISVNNSTEAQVVVDKIIDYESNPLTTQSFYDNALTCAQYQDDDNNGFADRRFTHTSEEIRDYLQNDQSYQTERIYYTSTTSDVSALRYNNGYYSGGQLLPSDLRDLSFNWKGNDSDITSSINSGKFLVFHRDHGYVGGSGWAHPYYTTATMENLSNADMLPVIFSINCHTGEFQLSNCFAEKLVNMDNKGAVGVVAAAYYSYSGYNDAFAEGMIDAIWPNPGLTPTFGSGGTGSAYSSTKSITTMGDVVNTGLYAMEVNWGGTASSDQYQYELFHFFGDPAMKIWTTNPNLNFLSAVHNATIDCSGNTFQITGANEGAIATLVFNDELIGSSIVGADGTASINYTIQSPGSEVMLTLSKTNCKPFVATLSVTGSCGFPPEVSTESISDITENSATVAGEVLNDFGYTVTESGIVYSQTPNPEIGQPGVLTMLTDPTVTTGVFSLAITNLTDNTQYYLKAFAINANGTGYSAEVSFSTSALSNAIPYLEGFENGGEWPLNWSTDNELVWGMNTNWNGAMPPGGYNVYSDYYPAATGSVFSPVFDATNKQNLMIKFYHFWRANYSSGSQEGYLWGSRDGGDTWPYLIDEWHHNNPGTEEGEKIYDISSWADGYEKLAFKWVVTHNNDWYWQFDNFEIFEEEVPGLWTGYVSNDWNEAGNWHDGMVPVMDIDVVIPSNPAGGNFPEVNSGSGAECNNLTIEADAHLFIPFDNSMTVNGILDNQAEVEGLVVKSGPTGRTGSLIHDTPDVEATVEQYLTQMQWHLIGMPLDEAFADVFYLTGLSEIYLNTFDESTGNWGPWIVPLTTPLELGRGYECWVDCNVNQDETILFEGIINTGEFTTGVDGFFDLEYTPGQGMNLMSNPYPCGMEVDIDTWTKKNVANIVWTWNEDQGNYLYWNSTDNGIANGYGTLTNGTIPPMQGFFVQATGTNPQMTIPLRSRRHDDQSFYKSASNMINNSLQVNVSGNNYKDAIFITFEEGVTDGFDLNHDVQKLFGLPEAPQLYSIHPDQPLSINALPLDDLDKAIPLGFTCDVAGEFEMTFKGLEEFEQAKPVFIQDHKFNTITEISDDEAYNFTHDPLWDNSHRFTIYFGNPSDSDLISESITVYSFGNSIHVITGQPEPYSINIYDMLGQRVWQGSHEGIGTHEINFKHQSGTYIVQITQKQHIRIQKVTIN